MSWNLSCPDWWERLQTGRSLVPDLPLNQEAGERAVAILNKLRLADVTNTPTFGDAGGQWFRDIVRALFGAVVLDPASQTIVDRYINEIFLLVPKKNSKTTDGALLMLCALLMNRRPNAPFLMTGPVQDTAETAYDAAVGAIELDPVLKKKLHTRDHLKKIVHRETKAELQIMTFDPKVVTGQKVVGALIDEVHVLGKVPRADKALLQLRGGMQPFPEAFLVMITTQSDEAPTGVFEEELTRAREVRDGKRQGKLLPVMYEFPMELQRDKARPWLKDENWIYVTPNHGKSIFIPRLKEAYLEEAAKGEKALRAWASQHLNIQIGVSLGNAAWAGAQFWEQQTEVGLSFEDLLERCEIICVGIDGGGLDDLFGLSMVGRERGTGYWLHWAHAWCHRSVLELRKDIASHLESFERDGDLTIIDEMGDDIVQAVDFIERVYKAGLLDKIGVDPFGIGSVVDEITDREIEQELIVGISQGWKMAGTIKTLERKLVERIFFHAGRPMMAWCAGNARVVPTGNATLITKQVSGTAKIDPLMATFDAVTLLALNPQPRKKPQFRMLIV